MFVFLSKIFNACLSPDLLIFFCLLLLYVGIYLSANKRFKILGIFPILFYLFMISPLGPVLVHQREQDVVPLTQEEMQRKIQNENGQPVVVIVLSGGVAMFKKDVNQFEVGGSYARMLTPLLWTRSFSNVFYIFSAGLTDDSKKEHILNEGHTMALMAQDYGVPRERIFVTIPSHNTFEEALAVKDELKKINAKLIFLSTSALHMKRAHAVYKSAGIEAQALPAKYESGPYSRLDQFFSLSHSGLLRQYLHEVVGDMAYSLTGKTK